MKKLFSLLVLLMGAMTAWADAITAVQPTVGDGQSSSPYQIASAANLVWFAQQVNAGKTNICGKLTADIELGTELPMIGTSAYEYSGTFDGNSHYIYFNYTATEALTALFRYLNGATIKNLMTTGGVHTSYSKAAGLAGQCKGNCTFERIASDVVINSGFSGKAYYAGLVVETQGGANLTDCCYFGSMVGVYKTHFEDFSKRDFQTSDCSGMVGLIANKQVTLKNCYVALSRIDLKDEGNKTFAKTDNDGLLVLDNCYYTTCLGDAQGTEVSLDVLKSEEMINKLGSSVWLRDNTISGVSTDNLPTPMRTDCYFERFLKFTASTDGTIQLNKIGTLYNSNEVEYFRPGASGWETITYGTAYPIATGESLWFRRRTISRSLGYGLSNYLCIDRDNYFNFSSTAQIAASQNLASMLNITNRPFDAEDYALYMLFANWTNLTSAPELPVTSSVGKYAYSGMFYGCTGITGGVPTRPAPAQPQTGNGASSAPYIISNVNELIWFAEKVNSGSYSLCAELSNDIDCASVNDWPTIGLWGEKAYTGTFNGNGHRIKNLKTSLSQTSVGLFGCTSGNAVIKNLIIDSSCEFNGTGYGAAGIVGCMARPSEELSDPISITLEACGNEATVNGQVNAAGLIGGVYNTETNGNASVTITNCYNTGNITGSGVENGESAALIAYGNSNTTVKNCYNTGIIVGNWEGLSLVRVKNESDVLIQNTYNLDGVAAQNSDGVNTVTTDQVRLGYLCNKLNLGNSSTVWAQNLETDAQPIFGTAGLHYARTMANEWGTVVLPYDVTYDQSNGNYKLYKLSAADSKNLTFTEYAAATIAAGTPMAMKKLSGEGIDILPASTPNYSTTITPVSEVEGWAMKGSYSALTGAKEIYYIANNQFWYAEDPISIAPYRAWFTGPEFKGAALRIVESDGSETSTIGEITADGSMNFFDTPIYTIQGQRQQAGQKGLQIRNGRVVLMK